MKIAALLAAALCLTSLARAQNDVELNLLVVRLPEAATLPLLPALRDAKQSTESTNEIVKMISEKRATLVGWPTLRLRSGQRAVVEQIDEFRYTSEYDLKDATAAATKKETEPSQLVDAPPPAPAPANTTAATSGAVPASFETRNVGITLEAEPTIAKDGKTLQVSFVAQHVAMSGFRKVQLQRASDGNFTFVEQPQFVTSKVTTGITVQDGGTILVGVFKLPHPSEEIELLILQANIRGFAADARPGKKQH
jgi:hypothetical protein